MTDRSTGCVDCGTETLPTDQRRAEYYIVTPKVWSSARMTASGGCLCIGCLENRLARRLTAADFADMPINDLRRTDNRTAWTWRTPRLIDRLTGQLLLPLDEQVSA